MKLIKKNSNFSIVIPVYNEENNIGTLIKKINNHLCNFEKEIIIVNDCSKDNTLLELRKIERNKNFNIYSHDINLGQSKAIHTGIQNAKYDTIVTIDGDGQNDPKDIEKLIKIYFENDNISMVGGIRKNRKDNFIKIYSSILANKIRMLLLKDDCPDTGCSLKVFNKNIFLSFPFFDGIHRFLPALFIGFEYKTRYVEVSHFPRKFGYSKYGTVDRMLKGVRDIIKVMKIIKKQKL